jgi:inosine-uridine nucleoside N-ribohydrolase
MAVALLAFAATLSAVAWAREDAAGLLPAEAPRMSLSRGQAHALSLLPKVRPPSPAPLLLFTDPNKDPDDLSVLVLASALQQQGFLDLRCVLTTLGDRETRVRRAGFAKDVLEDLGLEDAKVGVGMDYAFEVRDADGNLDLEATAARRKDHQVFIDSPLGQPQGALETDALALLEGELARVPERSAVLLVNAGMADLAALLRAAPEVVRQKTAKVVIMGGVDPRADERGFDSADERAYNNTTDQPSADYVYERLQDLGLPLVVVTKEAAYASAAPRSFYDGMATTGNPIGVYLRDQQKAPLDKP